MLAIWTFAAGLLHVALYPSIPPRYVWFIAIILSLAFTQRWPFVVKLLGPFFVGGLIASCQLSSIIAQQLPLALDRVEFAITFEITSLVEQRPKSTVFTAKVLQIQCGSLGCQQLVGERLRLSWYQADTDPQPGDIWAAQVKLKRPRGLVNKGGFDYQAWLLAQGVVATGYIKADASWLARRNGWASMRGALQEKIIAYSAGNDFARFWPALIMADRSGIHQADWQVLQHTGTVHLVAISGLHIGLVAVWLHLFGFNLARLLAVAFARYTSGMGLVLWLPRVLSCVGAFSYAALAGFSIPTTRALAACVAVQAMGLLGWKIPWPTLFALALAVVGLSDPLAIIAPGFWLSFLAVISLLVITQWGLGPRGNRNPVAYWVQVQLLLTLALMLPLLVLGQLVSLTAPLANLLAVPVVALLVVPLLLFATLFSGIAAAPAQWLFNVVDVVFGLLWQFLATLAALPVSTWWPSVALSWVTVCCSALAIGLILTPAALRLRGLGFLVLLVALLIPRTKTPLVQLTAMDVGQGLALLLRVDEQILVYDTGPRFSDQFDAGSRILLPYLRQQGIGRIHLVVSHADNDHSGGADSLVQGIEILSFRSGERLQNVRGIAPKPCVKGQNWSLGRASLRVLWPPQDSSLAGNNASCTLLVEFQHGTRRVRVLLAGDIDAQVEEQLLAQLPSHLDIVIAPHHGSISSSSFAFVRRTAPRYVVYSAGYKNSYGHPHQRVRRRYQREAAIELNTADSGAIQFTWDDQGEQVDEARKSSKRAWYW